MTDDILDSDPFEDPVPPPKPAPPSDLPPDFGSILDDAAKMTDQQLNDAITGLTKLTPQDINDLNLTPDEKTKLAQLSQLVRSKANSNDMVAAVIGILGTVGSVVVKLALKSLL